jgi:hypothetical protein
MRPRRACMHGTPHLALFYCRIGKHWPTEMHTRDAGYPNFRTDNLTDANTLCGAQVSGPYAEQVQLPRLLPRCSEGILQLAFVSHLFTELKGKGRASAQVAKKWKPRATRTTQTAQQHHRKTAPSFPALAFMSTTWVACV